MFLSTTSLNEAANNNMSIKNQTTLPMKHIKTCQQYFSGRKLLLWWMITSVLGWTLGWAVADLVGDAIETMGWTRLGMVGILTESVAGAIVGFAQWIELRHYIRHVSVWIPICVVSWVLGNIVGTFTWNMPGEWIWQSSSAVGAIAGALVGLKLWRTWQNLLPSRRIVNSALLLWLPGMFVGIAVGPAVSKCLISLDDVVAGVGSTGAAGVNLVGTLGWAVFGLVVGIAQWLVLRRYSARAGWWIVANVFAWLTGATGGKIGDGFVIAALSLPKVLSIFISWIQVSMIYSFITGCVLVWILRKQHA
jgi:hypothetical protein